MWTSRQISLHAEHLVFPVLILPTWLTKRPLLRLAVTSAQWRLEGWFGEALNLRTTRIRDVNGTVWHVPNGEILRVGNKSQQWARAVLDIVVAHGTDVDAALKILKEVADDVAGRPEMAADVLEEAEVWGVEALTQIMDYAAQRKDAEGEDMP